MKWTVIAYRPIGGNRKNVEPDKNLGVITCPGDRIDALREALKTCIIARGYKLTVFPETHAS